MSATLTDLATRVVAVSDEFTRATGLNRDQVLGRTIDEIFPGSAAALEEVSQALAAGAPHFMSEGPTKPPGGGVRWVRSQASYWFGDAGEPIGYLFVNQDITAEREAEAKRDELEALLLAVMDNIPASITVQDVETEVFLLANAHVLKGLGLTQEAYIGKRPSDIYPADRLPLHAQEARRAIETGEVVVSERRIEFGPNTGNIYSMKKAMFRDATGRRRMLLISEDVTEARRAAEALQRALAEAQAANEAKSQFLANMSHEVRTPLTGVVGFARLLQAMNDLPPAAQAHARRISTSAEALLSVVNDVLDFSKLEASQVELDPQPFEPRMFLEETVDLVRVQAAAKNLALTLDAPEDLPAVVADIGRLRQVMLNLLTNALKFTAAGRISVAASYADGALRVKVSDTGPGIAPEDAAHLFQRFSQVDGSNARRHGGTGLGLAICHGLVELMGGQIGLESAPGQGSTFWFTIAAPAAGPSAAADPAAPAEAAEFDGEGLRILVVDDVQLNRDLVAALLSPFDVVLREAASGHEAVKAAIEHRFDLILMDVQMPGMDGMAAARAIRANSDLNRGTPILALSANVLPDQIAACVAAGMNDHIAKPISPGDLLGKLAKWAAHTQRPTALAS